MSEKDSTLGTLLKRVSSHGRAHWGGLRWAVKAMPTEQHVTVAVRVRPFPVRTEDTDEDPQTLFVKG